MSYIDLRYVSHIAILRHNVGKVQERQPNLFSVSFYVRPSDFSIYSKYYMSLGVHLDPCIRQAEYQNLKNGQILSLDGYQSISEYVCLFVFALASVSGQEIWPDTQV